MVTQSTRRKRIIFGLEPPTTNPAGTWPTDCVPKFAAVSSCLLNGAKITANLGPRATVLPAKSSATTVQNTMKLIHSSNTKLTAAELHETT